MFYERAQDYIADVMSGKEIVCKYIRQAVERHVRDMAEQGPKRGFWFDERSARLYLEAVSLFKHTRGLEFAGKPFDLQPFQAFTFMSIFGWKRYEDGVKTPYRRFTRVYKETAKKSGKSEESALLAWLCLLFDGEYGAQIYSAATKVDQAKIVFAACSSMAKFLKRDSKRLDKMINRNNVRIYIEETESFIQALSSDYHGIDGIDTHVGIIDEFHAHKDSLVSDSIRNSMAARLQPILFTITTAGFNLQYPCYQVARKEAVQVLDGTIQDDSLFALIFTLDKDDDWRNPDCWIKANPNIGRTVKLKNMMDLFAAAVNGGPMREVDFMTKNLNIWVASQYNWIGDDIFMDCKQPYSLKDQQDRQVMCWGGMDLGQTSDMTCFAQLFDPDQNDGKYIFVLYTWLCEETYRKRIEQGEPHAQWVRDGELEITPGNTTDYGYLEQRIIDIQRNYNLVNVGYDVANSSQTAIKLENEGVLLEQFSQGILNMNNPTKELAKHFYDRNVVHNGNGLMRFMFQSVEIVRDSTGNIKVSKKDPNRKVDGVVAMVMALGQYMEWKGINGNMYKEGFRFL